MSDTEQDNTSQRDDVYTFIENRQDQDLRVFNRLFLAQENGGVTHEQLFQDYDITLYVPSDTAFSKLSKKLTNKLEQLMEADEEEEHTELTEIVSAHFFCELHTEPILNRGEKVLETFQARNGKVYIIDKVRILHTF